MVQRLLTGKTVDHRLITASCTISCASGNLPHPLWSQSGAHANHEQVFVWPSSVSPDTPAASITRWRRSRSACSAVSCTASSSSVIAARAARGTAGGSASLSDWACAAITLSVALVSSSPVGPTFPAAKGRGGARAREEPGMRSATFSSADSGSSVAMSTVLDGSAVLETGILPREFPIGTYRGRIPNGNRAGKITRMGTDPYQVL